ncbi:uncharacterized protein MELLADRAFT_64361 [Melampsora larici-populina 98AG31]|uniref:SUZ RNA-binding domain-containing n=1 Tax=Melampsora larici-populina (strain 98AG31 / pathotype 3-4-7) TaxID=747676 RepID=F4RR58_MELLP|nr:uncharacterized protein MELLADRAFT_64361 [Melampsora larici-populina 98AG31]EGG05158.1 hypothetical protein MELLADRAFT_64361 [Melampsora larici-populina 98AG31]
MPASSFKLKEEPCEDWEDLDYDIDPSPPSHTADEEATTTISQSTNTAGSSDASTRATSNSLLWTCANKNPQYVIIPSNSSAPNPVSSLSQRPLPQNAIFGTPSLTILKRSGDSSTAANRSVSPVVPPVADIKQREKAYLEARERIFSQTPSEPDPLKRPNLKAKHSSVTSSIESQSDEQVSVERQPKGPSGSDAKGFKNRTRAELQ